jgi:hypothetical protein
LEERIKRAGKTRPPPTSAPPKPSGVVAPTARTSPSSNSAVPEQQISQPLHGGISPVRNQQSPNYGKVLQQQNLNSSPKYEENPTRFVLLFIFYK